MTQFFPMTDIPVRHWHQGVVIKPAMQFSSAVSWHIKAGETRRWLGSAFASVLWHCWLDNIV